MANIEKCTRAIFKAPKIEIQYKSHAHQKIAPDTITV